MKNNEITFNQLIFRIIIFLFIFLLTILIVEEIRSKKAKKEYIPADNRMNIKMIEDIPDLEYLKFISSDNASSDIDVKTINHRGREYDIFYSRETSYFFVVRIK